MAYREDGTAQEQERRAGRRGIVEAAA